MLYLQIKNELKEAMKSKNTEKRDVLKMVIDKARAIMKRNFPNEISEDIPDTIVIMAIEKELKQLNQTKDALKDKENSKLYCETALKIGVLSAYLPKKMTKIEVEQAVSKILSQGDYPNFGMKMKAVMAELKGKADNALIKEVVQSYQ